MRRNFLSKNTRLLNKKDFTFVFQKPVYIKKTGIILFSRTNTLQYPRIGLIISKKYVKHAHARNRIKRHMRETFRMNQHNLPPSDFIFTLYSTEITYFTNYILIQKLQTLWYQYFL